MAFNESEWIRILFLLSDTKCWINEMERDLFNQVSRAQGKSILLKKHYLSSSALAHILERHYFKIPRHPGTAKFTIPVFDILYWIKEAYELPAKPQLGTINFMRCLDTGTQLGHDQDGNTTTFLTLITGPNSEVITAFPGILS